VLRLHAHTGARVDGPRLRGTVVPGGGDWAVLRGEGLFVLDARYLIPLTTAPSSTSVNRGYWRALTPEALARAQAGERLDESEAYFRTSSGIPHRCAGTPLAGRDRLRGMAREEAGQICIRFYEVL